MDCKTGRGIARFCGLLPGTTPASNHQQTRFDMFNAVSPIPPLVTRRGLLVASGAMALAGRTLTRIAVSPATAATPDAGDMTMGFITTKDGTEIFYKDWGPKDAQPIVFHHGWPLTSDDWDAR